jgi:hypothetical protein
MYHKSASASMTLHMFDVLEILFPLTGSDDPRTGELIHIKAVRSDDWPGQDSFIPRQEISHYRTRANVHISNERGIRALGIFNAEGCDLFFTAHSVIRNGDRLTKADAAPFCDFAWADCDDPIALDDFQPKPTLAVETSPGRHQLYWLFDAPVPSDVTERINYSLTRSNKFKLDQSGWALNKLLRVPCSMSYKRDPANPVLPVQYNPECRYTLADFGELPLIPGKLAELMATPIPDISKLRDRADILKAFPLPPHAIENLDKLASDRSAALYAVYCACRRLNMPPEDCLALCLNSPNDKFARGGLFQDVLRGYAKADEGNNDEFRPLTHYGNAERLIDTHKDELRYCAQLGGWHVFEDGRWIVANDGELNRRAVATLRAMHTGGDAHGGRCAEELGAAF